MATELLPIGQTETTSGDLTLPPDVGTFIYLTAASDHIPTGMRVLFQVKSGSAYHTHAVLDAANPGHVFNPGSAAVTYRLKRERESSAGRGSVGVASA